MHNRTSTFGELLANTPLLAAAALSIWHLFFRLGDAPPFLDFDVCAEAIFAWSYLYNLPLDFPFPGQQASYILSFQAERLPFSILIAPLIRGLDLFPHQLELFFKTAACITTLSFVLTAGALIRRDGLTTWTARIFLIGAACSFTPLVLLARNGVFYNLFACLLFWLIVYLIDRYTKDGSPWPLYICSFLTAVFALNKYPPMATLPFVALAMLIFRNKLSYAARDRHTYFSLAIAGLLAAGFFYLVGAAVHGGISDYVAKLQKFSSLRGSTFSVEEQLIQTPLSDKLSKLVNQQIVFKRDNFGDLTREDEMFSVDETNPAVYLLVLFFLTGLVRALIERRKDAVPFAAVLISILAVFLTISFPEGRYIVCITPCYFYFAWLGIHYLFSRTPKLGPIAAALIIFSQVWFNQQTLFGSYNSFMHELWADREGIHELALNLPAAEPGTEDVIGMLWPRKRKLWFYFAAQTGLSVQWLTQDEFREEFDRWRQDSSPEKKRFFFYETKEHRRLPQEYIGKGFIVVKEFRTRFQDDPRVLLQYPPPN